MCLRQERGDKKKTKKKKTRIRFSRAEGCHRVVTEGVDHLKKQGRRKKGDSKNGE